MKRLTFYMFLLQGLCLGIAPASAKELGKNLGDNIQQLDTQSQVWVIKDNQLQREPFVWAVKDTNKAGQQPLLQLLTAENKSGSSRRGGEKEELEDFNEVIKNTQKQEGMFTLYRDKEKGKVYLEVKPEQINRNFLATMTLESGIGERGIYSGMPLQDFLFYFQRVNNHLHFVIRNVNFRTRAGDPQARSVARSFSDSVLYALPIKSIHPERKTLLIDLGDLLLKDVPGLSSGLSWMLDGQYSLDEDKSYFGNVKAFEQNIEIESVYGFSGEGKDGMSYVETLPDSRALTLRVRYSLSQLPEKNTYVPRLADERVGYFVTAYQDLSNHRTDPFTRYINRWSLEKEDPKAPLSRPKKPIVFWIENAVPLEYREAIKEGVLMWNKAFEAAGFQDAIEVRQMPDNATWDPADVRYNTIRWINTIDGYFAMGPSRVNPLTGEILDADILVDASFVRGLQKEYSRLVEQNSSPSRSSLTALIRNRNICGNGLQRMGKGPANGLAKLAGEYDLCFRMEAAENLALGSTAMSLLQNTLPSSDDLKQYINQYLRLVIAHEVGHTLGLRHNFRGSTFLKPEEMNNTEITQQKGMTTSVMDYIPPNLAPQGVKQGDYFPNQVGPYDVWAIQYAYSHSGATNPMAEKRFLDDIASQSYRPELSYATDEDISDLDPTADAWDNSDDVLVYSQWQLENARLMWERLNKRYPIPGESYTELNERFNAILGHYLQHTYYTSKYIGGQSFFRNRGGNPQAGLPFQAVPVQKQRQALATLQRYIFSPEAFEFPPQLLNKLAPSRWYHWGSDIQFGRLDYPIHDLVLFLQSGVLRDLLSRDRLTRLKDIELKNPNQENLTIPELFDSLQTGIWTEIIKADGKPVKIQSLRRGLQREYLNLLTDMVLRKEAVPEDARTLAWYKLRQLGEELNKARGSDEYTKAHILETRDRINKTLNASVQGN
ncbi:MAG: zinc-dependent metalloprotease [Nostocaceae cyanobacterium]|nr:zinc-dependent metalloprotease [Nostocaceae cyanobacterium]